MAADPPQLLMSIPMGIGLICGIGVLAEMRAAARHAVGLSAVDLALNGYKWFDADNFDEDGQRHLKRMWMFCLGVFGAGLLFVVLMVAWDSFVGGAT